MSDLYPGTSETSEPTADGTQEPSRDWTRYESGPERGRSHEHRDAGTQTMLADEDRLPTRQGARAATWGDNPVYEDEDDPGVEDEGDFGTLTADEDQLPTRQDARAATWGDNPVYEDENGWARSTTEISARSPPKITPWTVMRVTGTRLPPMRPGRPRGGQMSPMPGLPTAVALTLPSR
jgi:hypothetical protein